jgi:hypothetical protein
MVSWTVHQNIQTQDVAGIPQYKWPWHDRSIEQESAAVLPSLPVSMPNCYYLLDLAARGQWLVDTARQCHSGTTWFPAAKSEQTLSQSNLIATKGPTTPSWYIWALSLDSHSDSGVTWQTLALAGGTALAWNTAASWWHTCRLGISRSSWLISRFMNKY